MYCGPVNFDGGFQLKPAVFRPSPVAKLLGRGSPRISPMVIGSPPIPAGSLPKMLYESTQLRKLLAALQVGMPGNRFPLASTNDVELRLKLLPLAVTVPRT